MIANLKGRVEDVGVDTLIIDVNGVGYLVHCSARTLSKMPKGDHVTVHTEMQVSETDMRLMGFAEREERDCYRLLREVQGVGGKVALAILSALEPREVAQAVMHADKAPITRANGVGPKLAQRIVNELKDKMGSLSFAAGALPGAALAGGAGAAVGDGHAADAVSALANLGFKPAEASGAVAKAVKELGEDASLDALVRLALKKVGS